MYQQKSIKKDASKLFKEVDERYDISNSNLSFLNV